MLRLEAFDIVSCERPSLALEQAEARSFDIVISDFRMPEMTGIALMEKLAELIPYSMRLLMSGNADLRDVIEAVNAGSIHQFIEKPWNDGAVKVTLRRIAAEIKTRRENQALMTAIAEQNTLLTQASERAELEMRRKERLFATISHEIRNPLHGLQGVLVALKPTLEGEQKQLLESAVSSAEYMSQVVNDVLDYSQGAAGKIQLSLKPFSPGRLIDELIQLMEPLAASKQLVVSRDQRSLANQRQFLSDEFRVRQILTNLLSNAIKYTESGRVEVCATETREGIYLDVIDTGIGIPEDKLGDLFGEYVMVDPEHARTYGGTGLGLRIVKTLVELMSGDITVESKVGEGTRITIALPMETTEAEWVIDEPQTDPKQVLGGKTFWVVDDMRANRLVVEQMAARYGAKIRSFESGEALLSQADAELDADVMLLDYNMPSMTGHELLLAIKRRYPEFSQPIFAMTASLNFEGSEQIKTAFDGMLTKPFDVEALVNALSGIDSTSRDQSANQEKPLKLANVLEDPLDQGFASEPDVVLDTDKFEALSSEMGTEVMQELLLAFFEILEGARAQIAPMALSPAELIEVAHALAPTAELMGFTPFAVLAREIDAYRASPPAALSDLRADEFLVALEAVLTQVEAAKNST
jgi:signal transduction histidine kinase